MLKQLLLLCLLKSSIFICTNRKKELNILIVIRKFISAVKDGQKNKLWGIRERRQQVRGSLEPQHSSTAFLYFSTSFFCLQLDPPTRQRAGGEHDKDCTYFADVPQHRGVLCPSWTGQPWKQTPHWDFTGTNCAIHERNGWSYKVWAPHSNPSLRIACVLGVPWHGHPRAPASLEQTQSYEGDNPSVQLGHHLWRMLVIPKSNSKGSLIVTLPWIAIAVCGWLWKAAGGDAVLQNSIPFRRCSLYGFFFGPESIRNAWEMCCGH